MKDVVLSAGVRQNLLSLQSTAQLMSTTQYRLATGKKVNTALDNPVNFFTAAGLQTRAGDLGALADSMSNGIKTLQAADNGLTSITTMLQSMKSTLLQARQDKSFKSEGYALGSVNTASMQYMTFSGGSIGTTPVQVALTTNVGGATVPGTAAVYTGGAFAAMNFTNVAATAGAVTSGAFTAMDFNSVAPTAATITGGSNFSFVDVSGGAKSFTLDVGGGPVTINLLQGAPSGGDNQYTAAELQAVIDASAIGAGIVSVTGGGGATPLTLSTVATGAATTITVAGTNVADLGFSPGDTDSGSNTVNPTLTFNVAIDGGPNVPVTINQAAVALVGDNDNVIDTVAELGAIIDAQLGNSVTVTSGAGVTLTSNTTGLSSSVAISGVTVGGGAPPAFNTSGITNVTDTGSNAITPTLSFNVAIDGGPTRLVTINQTAVAAVGNLNNIIDSVGELAAIVDAQLDATVTVDTFGGAIRFTSATTGIGSSVAITGTTATDVTNNSGIANTNVTGTPQSITGGMNTVKTIDEIINDINASTALKNRVRASNDGGKIRIQNLATGDLTVTGLDASGNITGGANTSTIEGNLVRANLAIQYNEQRDQLDKLATDSSFNGVNLLNGDQLKVVFNETGSNILAIQAKDENGNPFTVNATNLGVKFLMASDLDFDTSIDTLLDQVAQALNIARSQASSFGSYLSIVENRQDFTKAMINTLKTGADNLVLADTNEEGANLLALQTRQQLSTTALSLAAQADQAVLRLFG